MSHPNLINMGIELYFKYRDNPQKLEEKAKELRTKIDEIEAREKRGLDYFAIEERLKTGKKYTN